MLDIFKIRTFATKFGLEEAVAKINNIIIIIIMLFAHLHACYSKEQCERADLAYYLSSPGM